MCTHTAYGTNPAPGPFRRSVFAKSDTAGARFRGQAGLEPGVQAFDQPLEEVQVHGAHEAAVLLGQAVERTVREGDLAVAGPRSVPNSGSRSVAAGGTRWRSGPHHRSKQLFAY